MNSKAHLPLQTDPINRIGGKHRIFSQLQISDQFRGHKPDISEQFRMGVKCWRRGC